MEFRFDLIRGGNAFDAHRLLHLAKDHGLQPEMKERLLRATFTEGLPVADRATLVRLLRRAHGETSQLTPVAGAAGITSEASCDGGSCAAG